jgi:hypothetical protein
MTTFRDEKGETLFTDPFDYRRLFAPGQTVVQAGRAYSVVGAELTDDGQVVTVAPR